MFSISKIRLFSIIIFLSLNISMLFSQKQGIRLQGITANDGLSQSYANTIHEDNRGYLWFGTIDGLNRYDGYDIKVYKFNPNELNSISDNFIRCIVEDKQKRLWVGTDAGGLNLYDTNLDQFTQIPLNQTRTVPGQNERILDLTVSTDNILWIASSAGLCKLDLGSQKLSVESFSDTKNIVRCIVVGANGSGWYGTETGELFKFNGIEEIKIKGLSKYQVSTINDIVLDDRETLWLGTNTGLFTYNIPKNQFKRISLPLSGDVEEITSLAFGPDQKLWVGTLEHGLIAFDTKTENVSVFANISEDPNSLREAGIIKILFDKNNLLWIATRGEGIQFFDPQSPFRYYGYEAGNNYGLGHPSVRAILTDEAGLWVGGYEGLDFFSKDGESHKHYRADPHGLINNNVYTLINDGKDKLWIGTEGGGLFRLSKSTGLIDHLWSDPTRGARSNYIYEFHRSQDSLLYLGTGEGLYVMNLEKDSFKAPMKVTLRNAQLEALETVKIIAINEDRNNNLYVGSESNGLFVINKFNEPVAHYVHSRQNRTSLSSNRIKSLHFDRDETLWIGTGGGGLEKWVPEKESFIHYDENDGLADNTVYGILEDDFGSLWLSTNKGLSYLNKHEGRIRNFGIESGLQSLEYNTAAFHKSADGELFFGGIYGLNAFYPERALAARKPLDLIITDLKISNRPVSVGTKFLPTEINSLTKLTLTHRERLVSLDFSGMNFLSPKKTRYRYRIDGDEENWIYTSPGDREASFTNLPAGNHALFIQAAAGQSARYGTSRKIDIKVIPAPWRSWWAKLIYATTLFGLLWLIRRNELKKIALKRELDSKRQEAQKISELDELKSRIISNVSQELRTPLTLLESHIENLSYTASSSGSVKANVSNAQKDLSKITTLSNQLFELSRFASGKIKLQAREEELAVILSEAISGIRDTGKEKGFTFDLKTVAEPVKLYIDKPKFLQVIHTLLKNTMKASASGSNICLEIMDSSRFNDRGIGLFVFVQIGNCSEKVPEDKQSDMMDRIIRVDENSGKPQSDPEIDLALARELVELHGGAVLRERVTSDEIVFLLSIPVGRFHLEPSEIILDQVVDRGDDLSVSQTTIPDPTKQTILVVEDDKELKSFIHDVLIEDYAVVLANDGEEAYAEAQKNQPDLIISDIAMPRRSGLDLLKDIRQDPVLSNTPVVLLTALVSKEDRIKGYEATANDYISKPFSMDELKIRIRNILYSRKQLVELTSQTEKTSISKESSISKVDDQFFNKVKDTVENNLGNTELNAEMIAQSVFMSKRQLERKLKPMTGLSPGEFIRQVRFIRARQILQEGEAVTVAEVSYAVGFKNVKYFSRLFRNQFGHSPAELLKQ